jgi:hypothetical protein
MKSRKVLGFFQRYVAEPTGFESLFSDDRWSGSKDGSVYSRMLDTTIQAFRQHWNKFLVMAV